MRISILSSAHKYNDDRLYHHFAKSLVKKNNIVNIVSSDRDMNVEGDISVSSFNGLNHSRKDKIKIYQEKLSKFNPEIIICLEPLPIIAAKKYAKNQNIKIIYDITEWYPSKNQIKNHRYGTKWLFAIVYFFIFIYSLYLSDGFVIGEHYKGLIPKTLFPKKKNINIPYFPKNEYITKAKPNLKDNLLRLSYSGTLSKEKGLSNFLNLIKELLQNNNNLKIHVKIIGDFVPKERENYLRQMNHLSKNVSFEFFDFLELSKYITLINDTDIFLDLRTLDFINSHCLPIKIFYYMALERPIIYSNLSAIRKEVDTESFGYLVNPNDYKSIAKIIENYQNDKSHYLLHCSNARNSFETKYNWSVIETDLIHFIDNL